MGIKVIKNCPKCEAPVQVIQNTVDGIVIAEVIFCSRTPDCSWVYDPREVENPRAAHCTKCEDEVRADEDGICGNCL